MLRRFLGKNGYEVFEAINGEQGLLSYRDLQTDLVIVDLIMPEKKVIETIIALLKEFSSIKIIVISDGGRNSPNDYLLLAERLGANATIEKPLNYNSIAG